jgi:Flp pilus assembly protein TadD
MPWHGTTMAKLSVNQGRLDEAIKAFDEAIRLDPNYAGAWNNKDMAPKLLGRSTEANAAFASLPGGS